MYWRPYAVFLNGFQSKLYCFTAVGVGVLVGVHIGVGVTPNTKGPPAQIFFGWHVFCSPGHYLLISAMTLTFGVKVKL